ncbi:major facilitator superfamily domain-containing protein 12-like isoform X2 [Mercenaria mercenaria]|uniref:major facilitator superfamily domain-containing protein 12-like isoform X2 n=1 Tax=Mercenaria mercenaria TaxID=6596 RepID=UPI00234F4C73|nr:major facilitator superfamily domain-containing protein 12-like isoform X2 [Mercenaria mercenaria]
MSSQTVSNRGRLPLLQKFAYSVGHVLNDLTASMWFTYMIIYFHQVKKFDNALAGDLVLIGQISDAIFTPFIGYESDRVKGCFNMGKRKTWHFLGTLCVMCSFPFLFLGCITCDHAPDWSQFIYFAPFVVIFQFGWASTQINHLSLIPDLTDCTNERVGLNSYRYAFTVLSNMMVYGIAWLLFDLGQNSDVSKQLGPDDSSKFRMLVLIVVGLGLVFSLIFHIGVREKTAPVSQNNRESLNDSSALITIEKSAVKQLVMSWKCWLKEHQFYQVAVIYMSTRLVVNISQVYLPIYLVETIKLDKDSIAIIPLIVYVSGFVTSLLMKYINAAVGRKVTFLIGVGFAIGASIAFYFLPQGSKLVYGAAILSGIGGSTMLVTSLAMTADLIGDNTESGAFVYGAMSFTDKLSNGVAIALIQQLHPCGAGCCPLCAPYYRHILTSVPGGMSVIAGIALATLIPQTLGTRRKKAALLTAVTQNGRKREVIPEVSYESDDEQEPLLRGKTHSIQ